MFFFENINQNSINNSEFIRTKCPQLSLNYPILWEREREIYFRVLKEYYVFKYSTLLILQKFSVTILKPQEDNMKENNLQKRFLIQFCFSIKNGHKAVFQW